MVPGLRYDRVMMRKLAQTIAARLVPRRPDANLRAPRNGRRVLRMYLVKPSRYDDDGHLMQFRWGVIPANTLSVLSGLAHAWAESRSDVCLQVVVWDELVDSVLDAATIESIVLDARANDAELLIGLAGVQTGEYPRARDLALQFRRLGAAVAIGGFHISSDPGSRAFLQSVGVVTVTGEAESTMSSLLEDFLGGAMQRSYAVEAGLLARTGVGTITVPALDHAPLPVLEPRYLQRFFNPHFSTIDTSRGCPFVCSFCAVKNVMGRKVRARAPERVVDWIRHAYDGHGVDSFLLVDDDLFRSPTWKPILAGIADLRRAGRPISLFLQADIEAAAPPEDGSPGHDGKRFVAMAAEAGCYQAFMGFESLEPRNLVTLRKQQNQAKVDRANTVDGAAERLRQRYGSVVETWHAAGVGVHCGYMIGLPGDRFGCGARAARQLADIGVDIVSFFAATPLPGTEDHQAALASGSLLTTDWNAYDTTHFVQRHDGLSCEELAREYADAYRTFYSIRRLSWSLASYYRVPGLSTSARTGMLAQQLYYGYASRRGWHPMLGGIGRRRTGVRRRAFEDDQARSIYLGVAPLPVSPAVSAGIPEAPSFNPW